MKILWIMGAPLCHGASQLGYSRPQSGTWIDATYEALVNESDDIKVDFAFPGNEDRSVLSEDGKATTYQVGGVKLCRGKRDEGSAVDHWRKLIRTVAPDAIHIWGSEYTFPLDVMEAADGIPCVVSIQGVLQAIAKCSSPHILRYQKWHETSPLTWLKSFKTAKGVRDIQRQVKYEQQIVKVCQGIICDNEWAASFYRSVVPTISVYNQPLAISPAFRSEQWSHSKTQKNSLFTVAGRTPLKGLHQLIHALRIVKKTFPEIKLYVPGDLSGKRSSILFTLPYVNYLNKTIAEYNLVDNVEFCGKLSSQQMAEKMLSSSAFVMPSAIENHSSTLREAMHLGCPCISALVGGTHEFTQHGENSLTYRYEEFEVLAANIVKVLGDRQLAEKIGARARETINEKYPQNSIGAVGIEIYQDILRRKKAMSTGS